MIDADLPKTVIISYPKPAAEYRQYDQNSQPSKNNVLSDNGQQSTAPDLGGFLVQTQGDTGTAGTSNASITSSGVSNSNYNYSSPYIIPRHGPILEVEVNSQIEASNLEEQVEIAGK